MLQAFLVELVEWAHVIAAISIELTAGSENVVREQIEADERFRPEVCFDPLHVVQLARRAVDDLRRAERNVPGKSRSGRGHDRSLGRDIEPGWTGGRDRTRGLEAPAVVRAFRAPILRAPSRIAHRPRARERESGARACFRVGTKLSVAPEEELVTRWFGAHLRARHLYALRRERHVAELVRELRIPGFMSAAECAAIEKQALVGRSVPAEVLSDEGSGRQSVARRADVVSLGPLAAGVRAKLHDVRPKLEEAFETQLASFDPPQLLAYVPGGVHIPHRDAGDEDDPEELRRRKVTVIVFVNSAAGNSPSGYEGGELVLHLNETLQGRREIVGEAGLVVAFPSSVLHEVTPLRAGNRFTIVTWFW